MVEESDMVVRAVDTGTGAVEVVYTDGTSLVIPLTELLDEESVVLIENPDGGQKLKYAGLFRSSVDDLKPGKQISSAEHDVDLPRTVQLERYKQLVSSGANPASKEFRQAMDNLVPEELPWAVDAVDQMPWGPEAQALTQTMMTRWGKSDPMAALAHAESYESLRKRSSAVNSVLNSFAKNDPEGALSWYFSSLETDPLAQKFNPAMVFKELAVEDFQGAISRVNQIADPIVRRNSLKYMLTSVDGEQRYSTIGNLFYQSASLEDQKMFAEEYVNGKARYQPYEAAQWISNIENPDVQVNAIDSLIRNWSADRPDQAAEWVLRLADADVREKQLANISKNWSRADPDAAEAWLNSFPPDPDLDNAVNGYVATLRKENPAQASEWVEKIFDPGKRASATRAVAKEWLDTDPVAARDYILRSELDEKNRQKYLALADQAIAAQQAFEQQVDHINVQGLN
jgi:hypothetical protein